MNIAVLGAGAWGTAISVALSARHSVVLYARSGEQRALLERDRVSLPQALRFSDDLEASVTYAAAGDGLVLVATPTEALRSVVRSVRGIAPTVPLVWICKGFEQRDALLPHQVIRE